MPKKDKTVYYQNKTSGHRWLIEPHTVYKVSNVTTGTTYLEEEPQVEKRLKGNVEVLDPKAAKVLFGKLWK